jgi:uncharacterized protein with ParB-like and HNH nuclease domain
MPASFKTNPVNIKELLEDCQSGKLQLPDFQRSWVWDEDRIRSLISSVSHAFPIGALMALETAERWISSHAQWKGSLKPLSK